MTELMNVFSASEMFFAVSATLIILGLIVSYIMHWNVFLEYFPR